MRKARSVHTTSIPRAAVRRRRSLIAVVAAVVASLALVPGAAQAETSVPAQNAAGALQRYLTTHDDHFTNSGFADYGLTLDAVIAMDAAGVGDAQSARSTTFVADNIGSYIGTGTESYAGPTAKALLVSLSQGRTPQGFLGGVNLVARLKALQTTTGQFKDKSQFGDFSNTIGQSFALISLRKAGQSLGTKAVPFLANSQCPNGGFRLALSVNDCLSNSKADPDATSFAVQGLLAAPQTTAVKARISRAVAYLEDHQDANGGVVGGTATNTPNANSTGLAVLAFDTTGHSASATKGRLFLRSLRYTCDFPSPMRGAIAYDPARFAAADAQNGTAALNDQDLRSTAQATLGFAPVPLYKVTNVGAKPVAPAFVC
jgi:hypothetical protein